MSKTKEQRRQPSISIKRQSARNLKENNMTWLGKLYLKLKHGPNTYIFNDGNPIKGHYVIRFKDIYISVIEGDEDFMVGWTYDGLALEIPVREYWQATPPNGDLDVEDEDRTY